MSPLPKMGPEAATVTTVAVLLHPEPADDTLDRLDAETCTVSGWTDAPAAGRFMVCTREPGHAGAEHWDGFDGAWWVVG